ncbi:MULTISPECIES: penicillin-binding protein 1C [unclassified Variovorax]|uniref:penicillin-binding protein 1C n=1 Tax=unclassified Variovorax TaxID=663243 RepID=UPI00076CE041|nr:MULTISPECIES: penicillin-binding protein 1C [unclassified Variovorax]KWT83765.1 Multimodular transpeptidase-transglycosylase [Variovorax sp. WDL1]PNG46443.1 Penicillin-binding protein 2D [Variovorax sp. B2]PNG47735.1 Penicillin-binding protein 2D [Variovorax sp. B4]VTV14187.1 Penicillin-binding protein 2D [Variovorax sp. WDL1]
MPRTPHALLALSLLAALAGPAQAVPSFEDVKLDFRPSDIQVLDRDGEPMQRVRTDAGVRRGRWTALAEISPALRTAMLLSEDKRFYEHSGVDWRAVSAAAWGNLWNTRTRGASTITMQLAGLLDDDLRRGSGRRDLAQKLGQTVAAQQLERKWRKDQILEGYLNTVPFRGEIVGIDALSRTLFGKAPHGLDAREAAVAAALVRAPNAKPALVAQRACEVMRAMDSGARADCEALDMFASAALRRRAFEASEGIAPHLARRALKEAEGLSNARALSPTLSLRGREHGGDIRTTLRAPLQRFALTTLQRHLRELRGRNVEDGALVVLDNASGEVLAWVGSSGTLSRAAEVDGVLAQRQPGSTLKPLLYAQAIAERRLTAASLLDDSSAQISTAGGLYIPQNYDGRFKGYVSVRTALAASLNVPAVRTLVMVSPEAFARQLRAAGLGLAQNGDYYGYSLALGSAEVSLLGLTNGYRTLANGGRFGETQFLARRVPAFQASARGARSNTPAVDPRAAFIVGDILSDANARAPTFGLDSVLGTRFWSAVKTGTSKDMRDNWAVGWSERYTVGVWVGNAGGAPMWDVSGTSGAAPVWAELMGFLHRREASRAPTPPPGLVRARVSFGDELEAARDEWFIAGTEQPLFALPAADAGPAPRITAPADGTIIALDPDIPPRHQRVRFEAEGSSGLQWRIDGKSFARGASAQWLPWPGRHVVELLDARGRVVDQLQLEVRGAGVKRVAGK